MTQETMDNPKVDGANSARETDKANKETETEKTTLSQDPQKEETKTEEENDTSPKPKIHLADSPDEHDKKSHTFRQRRLTYTRHHVQAAAALMLADRGALDMSSDDEGKDDAVKQPAVAAEDEAKEKADCQSHEKQQQDEDTPQPMDESSEAPPKNDTETKKRKTEHNKDSSTTTTPEQQSQQQERPSKRLKINKILESRILHAGEIKRSSPPPTPTSSTQTTTTSATPQRGWRRKRQHRNSLKKEDEMRLLPFPRCVVGTYSCHGVEPLYDSDYEHEEDEEEDDEEDVDTVEDGEKGKDGNEEKEEKEGGGGGDGNKGEDGPATVAKINQDRGGVAFPYGNCPRTALFAAYDGHGDGGELVSQYSLNEVQRRLEIHPSFHTDIDKAFHETFLAVDEELKNEPDIEPLYSGSTACVVLLRDDVLTVANVGDSRAVIAREKKNKTEKNTDANDGDNDDAFESVDLSIDQNPDSPGEMERIEENGGFVSPPPEEGLSARVWLDESFTQIGLAMARSIGDHAVKPVGVIAEPVVTKHELTDEDEFMIIATDGVWEFISSDEAVNIVGKHLKKGEGSSKACQVLIEAAAEKWHEFEGDYRDDITALVIQLKKLWDSVDDRIRAADDSSDNKEGGVKSTVV